MVGKIIKQFLNRITRRQRLIGGIVAGVLVLTGIIAGTIAYHKRESLLASTLLHIQSMLSEKYHLDLFIGNARFSGLTTVTFRQLTIIPEQRAPLVDVEELAVGVKLWPLLTGDIRFGQVRGHNVTLQLIKKDRVRNYDFLFRNTDTLLAASETEEQSQPEQPTINLAETANQMLNNVLYKIPEDMDLRDLIITYQDDSTNQQIKVPQTSIDNGNLSAAVFLNDNEAAWQLSGKLNPDDRQLYIKAHANGHRIALPLLERKLGLKLSFDTIETRLREVYWTHNELLHIKGEWAVKNLHINHWRISQKDVAIPDAHIDAEVIIGNHHVELSKASTVTVENLEIHPFIRYTVQPHATYALGIETTEMEAQTLFDTFPKGLFESLEGVRVSGRIQYKLDAFLDTTNPDSVQFNSQMEQREFKVNSWGKANIPKINTSFTYTPYENEAPVRDIIVGPENPNFVPLGNISPYLRNAILTTEDPSFFSHSGFVEEAIRSSIAVNFKEKAFKRGGSTISMQLVKNAFLNRNKTVVRKLEEILLVWLMESTHVVTKERMYEVYLNIIEWGRNVYGVSEAARYYFSKPPSQLTLGESIYLASIVPRPKTGLYAFDYDGRLKPYISSYFNYIGNIMVNRGLAPADSLGDYGFYAVRLREALRPKRPATDTLQLEMPPTPLEDELEEVRSLLDRILDTSPSENQ